MNLYGLILPLGVVTYCMMIMALLTGKRIIKINFKYHRLFGLLAVVFATVHALLAIYLNYFY